MSALDKFEDFIEKVFDKPFSGLLRAEMQPVEIAKQLAKAMAADQSLGVDKIYVPNEYTVHIHPIDFQQFSPIQRSIERELAEYLIGIAKEQHFTLLSHPVVTIEPSERIAHREIRVKARLVDNVSRPAAPTPSETPIFHTQILDAMKISQAASKSSAKAMVSIRQSGVVAAELPINKAVVNIGRSLDNDVVIEDALASRFHAQISLRQGQFSLKDLQSRNGTAVNGKPIVEIILRDGDSITIGDTELIFSQASE